MHSLKLPTINCSSSSTYITHNNLSLSKAFHTGVDSVWHLKMKIVTSGVSKGSGFGPILCLLYIKYLLENISSQVVLFADDNAVYLTVNSISRLRDRSSKRFNCPLMHVLELSFARKIIM